MRPRLSGLRGSFKALTTVHTTVYTARAGFSRLVNWSTHRYRYGRPKSIRIRSTNIALDNHLITN